MRRWVRAFLVLLVLSAGARAFAAGTPADDAFAQGTRALQEQRWADAESALRRAAAERPGDPDVLALLAMAQYELGRLPESVASFRAALRGGTRYEARSLYTMGAALSRLGEDDEAQDAFGRVLRDHPDTPEAARLRETGGRFRAWTVRTFASLQHDDNPLRGTQADDLDFDVQPPDWMGQLWLSVERRFAASWPTARASLFRMDYREADDVDFTFAEARVEGPLHQSPRTRIVPGYAFRFSWLGRERYELRNELEVEATRALGRRYTAAARISAAHKDHPDRTFEDLDGTDVSGSLDLTRIEGPRALVRSTRVRLRANRGGARRDYLEHTDLGAEVEARLRLPARATLGVSYRWRRRDFDRTDPRFGILREDDRRTGAVSLTLPVATAAWLRLAVALSDNDSTIGRYDYRQAVGGVTVGARL